MAAVNRIVDAIAWLVRAVVLLQAAALFTIVIVTVFTRYLFSNVFSWSEEVPRYLLIWIGFLGAAACVNAKDHVAFTYIYDGLPVRLRSATRVLINLGIIGFGWVILYYGYELTERFGSDFMESIPFTNVWYYSAVPISGALIIIFAVRDELNAWFDPERRSGPEVPSYE